MKNIGEFNLYDRVRIKNTKITGNIVEIYNENDCEVEYDKQYHNLTENNIGVKTHNINELEKE